jgi:DNA topoisomerase VI subunit A
VLVGVPFFFLSDHDPDAFELFSNCKYGSRRGAFASKSMTCPRLEWKGPTRAQYEEISLQGVQRTVDDKEEASGALMAEAR